MQSRTLRAASRRGFTLIEILIVISIISLLTSMSLGGIMIAGGRAKQAAAVTFVSSLNGAVERYFMDTGRYPGAEWKDGENAFPALFEAIFDDRPPAGRGGPSAPYMDLKRDQVLVADGEGGYRLARNDEINDPVVPKHIQDPWGNPYVYRENRSRAPRSYTIRRGKADLYSAGPDGIDQTILGEKGEKRRAMTSETGGTPQIIALRQPPARPFLVGNGGGRAYKPYQLVAFKFKAVNFIGVRAPSGATD